MVHSRARERKKEDGWEEGRVRGRGIDEEDR